MNYALRNIVLVLITIFLLAFGVYYLFLRQEGQYFPDNWADMDCFYPVSVATDDLPPTLKTGVILGLNQCIKSKNNLPKGSVVSFYADRRKRLGLIEEVQKDDKTTTYIISTSYFDEVTYTVSPDDIYAYTVIPSL